MTVPYFAHDASGRIEKIGTAPSADEAIAQVPEPHLTARLGAADLRTDWWDGSVLAPRPVLPVPPALTAGVAADWALPEGAVVTVDPLNGAATVSETVAASFSIGLAAGEWQVSVDPPFPFLAAEWRIEVAS